MTGDQRGHGHAGSNPPPDAGLRPAGVVLRWVARVLDGLIVNGVVFLVTFTLGGSSNFWLGGLISGVVGFAYFVAFEVALGWTPCKKVLGLSVRGPDGAAKPTVAQSAIRNSWILLPIIPYIGGLLGVVAALVIAVTIGKSPTKQGKHDELAGGTRVLATDPAAGLR